MLEINRKAAEQSYCFTWPGKTQAQELAQTPTTAKLEFFQEESVAPECSDNIYIEGDNLEALKILQSNWTGKIRMIYIDPPYNTGKAFVYSDNFRNKIEDYRQATGHESPADSMEMSGRFHADWLNFMYPRLILARNLLSENGAIFISIDDTEVDNLRKLCDEIFGESAFVANFIWLTTKGAQGIRRRQMVVPNHEYILCYAKNPAAFAFRGVERSDETFSNPDNDPRGLWKRQYLQRFGHGFKERTVTDPATGNSYTFPTPYSDEKIAELVADNRIIFPKKTGYPARKEFLCEYSARQQLSTFLGLYSTKANTERLNKLFGGARVFNSPKPTELIQYLVNATTEENDVILDFFSGSATTAHAVLAQNDLDGGNRRFIMVQIPELCPPHSEAAQAGFTDIAQIGKERICRILKENQGMRVYKII